MTVYVHRGCLCLKYRLYRHTCQMILLSFTHLIENSTPFKLCRNCLIKRFEVRDNSKSDRRTTNFGGKRYLEDRRTAIFKDQRPICSSVPGRTTVSRDKRRFWACASNDRRPASVVARNATKVSRKVGKLARTTFFGCRAKTYSNDE